MNISVADISADLIIGTPLQEGALWPNVMMLENNMVVNAVVGVGS